MVCESGHVAMLEQWQENGRWRGGREWEGGRLRVEEGGEGMGAKGEKTACSCTSRLTF